MKWFSSLRNFLKSVGRQTSGGRRRACRPGLEQLEGRALPSASLHLAVMGDSLSAPYPDPSSGILYGSNGDLSWTQQLQALRPGKITIDNEAFPGATSDSLLHSGPGNPIPQATAVADLVAHHQVKDVVLIIGANDVSQDLPILFGPTPEQFVPTFVTSVVGNIETALQTVAAAGHANLVVSTIPDVTVTPGFQFSIPAPFLAPVDAAVSLAITTANQQFEAFAATHEIPVVDLDGLTHLTQQTISVGGVQIPSAQLPSLFSPDGFHPNTVGQGLLGNTVLKALHEGYDVNTRELRLSDQELLTETNVAHAPGRTYFDVAPFVLFHDNHDNQGHDRNEDAAGACLVSPLPLSTNVLPGFAALLQGPGWTGLTQPGDVQKFDLD
jgi:lysophospholipase L1-like esterase